MNSIKLPAFGPAVFRCVVGACAVALVIATQFVPRSYAADHVFKFGAPFPTGSSLHKGMLKFKEVVEAGSNGRIQIDLYPDAKLGDLAALMKGLHENTVDISLLGISTAADLPGGSALNIGALPFLYKNRAWVEKISNGPIYQQLFDDFAKVSNLRIFASYGERLPRAYQTLKGPIRKPEDLKGMRIRIAPIDIYADANRAFGAIPVKGDITTTYAMFQKGEIDGQENGIELAIPLKLYEVAKYFTEVDYAASLATWYTTEKIWQSLSPADRELMIKAAKAGGEVITSQSKSQREAGLAKLKAEGVIVTEADEPAFREAVKDLYKKYEGKAWPEGLVAKIRALQEQ